MSTLVTNKSGKGKRFFRSKPAVLVLLAGLCIVVDNIYAIFGHGVRSGHMSFMFLYPLGGAVVYFLLSILLPSYATDGSGRFGTNLLNSGLATLTLGSFLVGILEIAGSSSVYVSMFFIVGWVFVGIGFLALIYTGVCKK